MTLLDTDAPDFTLSNTAGKDVTLSETISRAQHHNNPLGPTVVIFFQGWWCSYCAEQLHTFDRLEYDLWRNHNVDILPIAGDSIPQLVEMQNRFDLGIELLSDPDCEVCKEYSGTQDHDHHGQIPWPGTYIVDPEGQVTYEHVATSVGDRTYANYVCHAITSNGNRNPFPES